MALDAADGLRAGPMTTWCRAGVIDIETGSTIVRGFHTRWLAAAEPGAVLVAAGGCHEVVDVISDSELALLTHYEGPPLLRARYALIRPFRRIALPEELHGWDERMARAKEVDERYLKDRLDALIAEW